ncbi:helix-turn-helix transcriptional regulator [Sutterella sp.]|uniref:helix-turn-helix transcriptional regulator n=1 Tax=Sutterella sp. TaxID=1981025 RepID=UPI0025FDBBA9|nr:hypothetical protein [uncultured Sutterella sp.]
MAGANRSKGSRGGARGAAGRGRAQAPNHPGAVLAEVLEDTPLAVAAKWFGLTPAELDAVLAGEAPVTDPMAAVAGQVFGTGAAPWIEMQKAWDEWTEAQSAKPSKSGKAAR